MVRWVRVVGIVALLGGCGSLVLPVPDAARLAPGALGPGDDPDVLAAALAQSAFADSSRTYGRPIDGARAAAALDYLAGEIAVSPRWSGVSPATKEQLLAGRDELRAALGVAPGAPSQAVVDGLTGAGTALAADDQAAALRAVASPVFTAGPDKTLATLANLPYLQAANVATQHLSDEMAAGTQRDGF